MSERYVFSEEEGSFVDMDVTGEDDPDLGEELLVQDVLILLNGIDALLAGREALVRYVRANNEFYGRWPAQIRSAWEELPEELREEISE